MAKVIRLKIKRQDAATGTPRWETFEVADHPGANVISCLMEVRLNPVTVDGQKTTPVVWESSCLEEVCGACTMLVNGKPRQSCSALIQDYPEGDEITLEPLTKFPLVRDLQVDRTRMFDSLLDVKAWIDVDGTYDLGPGPRDAPQKALQRYELAKCMTCGCCLEACPQYGPQSDFIGPAAVSQVRLFNNHPSGEMHKEERLESLMGDEGVFGCGNAQNCVKACPKEIPLTESLAEMFRETNKKAVRDLFRR